MRLFGYREGSESIGTGGAEGITRDGPDGGGAATGVMWVELLCIVQLILTWTQHYNTHIHTIVN